MRRMAAAVVTVSMLCGCATSTESKASVVIGMPLLLGGAGALREADGSPGAAMIGGPLLVTGMLATLGGLGGILIFGPRERRAAREADKREREVQERTVREIARASVVKRARALTNEAAQAARSDNCLVAARADLEVRSLDPEFHATVFVHDRAIRRCLNAASTASAPPVASP